MGRRPRRGRDAARQIPGGAGPSRLARRAFAGSRTRQSVPEWRGSGRGRRRGAARRRADRAGLDGPPGQREGAPSAHARSAISSIVFEDEVLLVVNKPAGLLSVPLERKSDAPSVYEQIEDHFRPFGKRRPFVVHRIDQDTSGLVVFAKDARAQAQLKAQFKRREPRRIYLAVVYGHPDPPAGTLAQLPGVGREGAHPEGNAPARPRGDRSDQRLPRARVVPRHVADRSAPADRPPQPDPHPGPAARPHAGRREALHLRAGRASHDPVRAPRAPRVEARVRPSCRRAPARIRGAAACGFPCAPRSPSPR